MYYSVIPITRLPRTADSTFTYESADELEPGTLVHIPFRNKRVFGIVTGKTHERPKAELKSITTIYHRVFTEQHIAFFSAIQKESFENLGTILETIYHKVTWRKTLEIVERSARQKPANHQEYNIYHSPTERISFLAKAIEHAREHQQSLLIIIPQYQDSLNTIHTLREQLPDIPIHLVSSKTSIREYNTLFTNHKPAVILSSRVGIFLPNDFATIICDDEPSPLYIHEEPSPTYDVRVLAARRAEIFHTTCIFSGYSLRVQNKEDAKHREFRNESLRGGELGGPPMKAQRSEHLLGVKFDRTPTKNHFGIRDLTPLSLVNLRDESKKGNILVCEEAKKIAKKSPVLFILNSQDFSKRVICKNCQYLFTCPICQHPYRAETEHDLLCVNCETAEPLPPLCPTCMHGEFQFSGMGTTQFIERALKELPKRKKIHHIATTFHDLPKYLSRDTYIHSSSQQTPSRKAKKDSIFERERVGLLSLAAKKLNSLSLSSYDAIIIPFFESFLTSQYTATEQFIHALLKLRSIFTGPIIIQFFNPDKISLLADIATTLANDQQFRKTYQYPPYGNVYRIRKKVRHTRKETKNKKQKPELDTDREILARAFAIPPDHILANTYLKRNLRIKEFIAKLPLEKSPNPTLLPQDFHLVKNPSYL